jgi:hypothetical protein
VVLSLAWYQHCGRLCALWFDVERTVTFDADGNVLSDVTDASPITVSALERVHRGSSG